MFKPFRPWTGNNTTFTIPFYEFFDETNKIIYPDGADFKSLFPPNVTLPDGVVDLIKNNYYYRQIAYETPQRFLRYFHNRIIDHNPEWVAIFETVGLLTPDDALVNYDMTETRGRTLITNATTTMDNTSTITANDVSTNYQSDTPDGSVADIETYMSAAGKNVQNNNDTSVDKGTSKRDGQNTEESTLTRKGNIGVTTFAQLLEGYRKAVGFNPTEIVFKDLDDLFLGVY